MTTFLQRAHDPATATDRITELAVRNDADYRVDVYGAEPASDDFLVSEYAVEATIRVGRPISDLATTADGRTLIALHAGDDAMSLIDTRRATVTATIEDLYQPTLAAVFDRTAYVHTSSFAFDSLSVIDTDTAHTVETQPVKSSPVGAVTVSPNGRYVYIGRIEEQGSTGDEGAAISIVDTSVEREILIALPTEPATSVDALAVSADGRRLYAAASDSRGGGLFLVDLARNEVVRSLRLNAPIRDLALSPDGRVVYLLTCDQRRGGAVHSVNTKVDKIAVTLDLGGDPTHFTLSPDGARLYVVDEDRVSVLCTMTNTIVDAIPAATPPSGVAVSRNGARVYIADYDGTVTVFSVAGALPEIVFELSELESGSVRRALETAGV